MQVESQLPPQELAADGFPIDPALLRRTRRAATAYLGLAFYHLAILIALLVRLFWLDADSDGGYVDPANLILTLAGFIAANIALAACAWNVLTMQRWACWFVVFAVACATAAFLALFALAIVAWSRPDSLGADIWTVLAGALQALAYSYAAWHVVGSVVSITRERRRALRNAAGPLPTTTL